MDASGERRLVSENEELCKVFVGGLDRDKTTENDLREYFSTYGTIVDSVVIRDKNTQASKGFGFVTMLSIAETDVLLLDKNEDDNEFHFINNKQVEVKHA